MEYSCIESDEEQIDFASEHDGAEDPLMNENVLDTSANTAILRPSMRQQPSSKMRPEGVTEKTIKSAQSISGKPSQNIILLLRCDNCSLLFQNETTLLKHEQKCPQVFEKRNSAGSVPVKRIKPTDLEDWRKRLPHVTVGVVRNEEKGTSSCPEDISLTTPPTQCKFADATPVVSKKVMSLAKLETPRSPAVSTSEPDPLAIDTTPAQPPSKSVTSTTPVFNKAAITLPTLDAPFSPDNSSCNSPEPLDTAPAQSSSYSVPNVSIPSPADPVAISSSISWPTSSLPPDVAANVVKHLARIENEITMLSRENCKLRELLQMSINRPVTTEENWEKLNTRSQLEEFEAKLGTDSLFAGRMFTMLKRKTINCKPRATIARSLEFLITRQLLISCSWTGEGKMGRKIPFYNFKHIQTLLRRVVGRQVHANVVEEMVTKILYRARTSLKLNPERKASYHQKTEGRSSNNSASEED